MRWSRVWIAHKEPSTGKVITRSLKEWYGLTIFNILTETRINLRGDLCDQSLRRSNIHQDTVIRSS